MIPAILAPFLPRIGIGALVLAVLVGGGWFYGHTRFNAGEAKVQAKWDRENAEALRDYEQRIRAANEAEKGFQNELKDLRDYVSTRPARVVRVCKVPDHPASPAPARGDGEGTAPAGILPQALGPVAGPDIGPDLYGDADRCDELSAQVRGLLAREKALESGDED